MDELERLIDRLQAKLFACEAFSTAIAAELEVLRPGSIDRIAAKASERTEIAIGSDAMATSVVGEISHFARRAHQLAEG